MAAQQARSLPLLTPIESLQQLQLLDDGCADRIHPSHLPHRRSSDAVASLRFSFAEDVYALYLHDLVQFVLASKNIPSAVRPPETKMWNERTKVFTWVERLARPVDNALGAGAVIERCL